MDLWGPPGAAFAVGVREVLRNHGICRLQPAHGIGWIAEVWAI